MKRDYKIYLEDILSSIKSIEDFTSTLNFESFSQDDKTSSAVVRKFEIIGEAVKQIPNDVKDRYPRIPWKEMAGMRDRLIHFYMGVDLQIIWGTIKKRLPDVKIQIEEILKKDP